MIVQEFSSYYFLIEQHEHARLSAAAAAHVNNPRWKDENKWNSLLYAIRLHDNAWIPLDQVVSGPAGGQPYSFVDYPLEEKLEAYKKGIEAAGKEDLYSGTLLSMHYASFLKNDTSAAGVSFFEGEQKRQKDWKKRVTGANRLDQHLDILQFFDDVSLYACMNKAGTPKSEEVSWFQNGFRHRFSFLGKKKVYPLWQDSSAVKMKPSPFSEAFDFTIQGWKLPKDVWQNGQKTIHTAELQTLTQEIRFV
ncbi:uncharacterized protein DUF3891 [Sinobaca qinghaiensis]|uniref:Uncharacterized protein DUF3891 n=1 Tax=Sinobaca qinghaiensis TaxID=342944 RepID=A0A419V2P9_9BACL|nr:DUF3891 family protein [Sinobaca qinghaiensis]RKD72805.1 uncharacterized protein DUF3891 [Sinobaca qinghaiensis]